MDRDGKFSTVNRGRHRRFWVYLAPPRSSPCLDDPTLTQDEIPQLVMLTQASRKVVGNTTVGAWTAGCLTQNVTAIGCSGTHVPNVFIERRYNPWKYVFTHTTNWPWLMYVTPEWILRNDINECWRWLLPVVTRHGYIGYIRSRRHRAWPWRCWMLMNTSLGAREHPGNLPCGGSFSWWPYLLFSCSITVVGKKERRMNHKKPTDAVKKVVDAVRQQSSILTRALLLSFSTQVLEHETKRYLKTLPYNPRAVSPETVPPSPPIDPNGYRMRLWRT